MPVESSPNPPAVSLEQLQMAIEIGEIGMFVWTMSDDRAVCNSNYCQIFGIPGDQPLVAREEWVKRIHPEDRELVRGALAAALRDRDNYQYEYRILNPERGTRWVESKGKIVRSETDGKPYQVLGVIRDITERKLAESRLTLALDGAEIGTWELDLGGGRTWGSVKALEIFGYQESDPEADFGDFLNHVLPSEREDVTQGFQKAIAENTVWSCQCRIEKIGGEIRWVWIQGLAQVVAGVPARMLGTIQDITERRISDETFLQNAERLHLAKSAAQLGIQDYNVVTGEVQWDARVRELWGVGPDEPVTVDVFTASIHPEDLQATQEAVARSMLPQGSGLHYHDYRVINRQDGATRWIGACWKVVFLEGKPIRMVGTVQDITRVKVTERSLQETLRQKEVALDAAGYGIWNYKLSEDLVEWDDRCQEIFGVWPGRFTTLDIALALVHPDDRHILEERIQAAHDLNGDGRYHADYRLLRPDGSIRWISADGRVFFEGEGENRVAVQFSGIVFDATERRDVEFARQSMDFVPDLRWRTDEAWKIDYVNGFWTEFTGAPQEDALEYRWMDYLHPADRKAIEENMQKGVDTSRRPDPYRLRHKDGTYRWFLPKFKAGHGEDGKPRWYGTSTEVDAMKRAELELKETLEAIIVERNKVLERKAAQLRRLANQLTYAEHKERARVAHILHEELQQLLFAMKLHLSLPATHRERDAGKLEKLLDDAVSSSRSLVRQLHPSVLRDRDFSGALTWIVEWFSENCDLSVRLKLQFLPIELNRSLRFFLFDAIRELLMNVVKHAGVEEAAVTVVREGDNLRVTVSDEGRGMPEFDFDNPGGTFGLFSVHERAEAMGGNLATHSRSQGVECVLTLPMTGFDEQEVVEEGDDLDDSSIRSRGPHLRRPEAIRVLIVDDHHIVREGLTALIRTQKDIELVGEAADGVQAVELADLLQPDLIIMDVRMPRMDGIEATRRIKEKNPEIQIIALSMHTEDERAQQVSAAGASAYVRKDGPSEVLFARIREFGAKTR